VQRHKEEKKPSFADPTGGATNATQKTRFLKCEVYSWKLLMSVRQRFNQIIVPLLDENNQLRGVGFYLNYVIRLGVRMWQQLIGHKCLQQASSLAFNTLVCLVPLSAFVLFLLKTLGVVESEGIRFMSDFLPGDQANEIALRVSEFANKNLANLGGLGFFLLLLVSTGLFNAIEKTFNDIWNTRSRLPFFQKYAIFYTILTIGSLLVLVWVSLFPATKSELFGGFLPWIFVYGLFLVAYTALPNTAVRWKAALVGALIAGTLFHIARIALTSYLKLMGNNLSEIYGALLFPFILAIWIYIVWVIVLLGAEVTNVIQNLQHSYPTKNLPGHPALMLEGEEGVFINSTLVIKLFLALAHHFHQGHGACAKSQIALKYGISQDLVNRIFNRFEEARLIYKVEGDADEYVPARALGNITLDQVVGPFEDSLDGVAEMEGEFSDITNPLFDQLCAARYEVLHSRSIEELLALGESMEGGAS
jgi:membrane protein